MTLRATSILCRVESYTVPPLAKGDIIGDFDKQCLRKLDTWQELSAIEH
jgi:hypothetical protein